MVNEYVLRRPLRLVVGRVEALRGGSSGDDGTHEDHAHAQLLPTFLYDHGRLPAIGVYYASDRLLADGNAVRLAASTWGPRGSEAVALDRYALDAASAVQVRVDIARVQDEPFGGLGADARDEVRARFGLDRLAARLAYRHALGGDAHAEVGAGVRHLAFLAGDCCDEPSLDARIAAGTLAAPPGYRDDYTAASVHAAIALDTRRPRPDAGSGLYGGAHAEASTDVAGGRAWLTYGGVLGATVDLTGHGRLVSMQLSIDMLEHVSGGAAPFTEDPRLGGELMPGFVPGWLTGLSTASAQLGYRWPVWGWLDARTRLTLGNAFGEHLAGLTPSKVRVSGDVGVLATRTVDEALELLVGFGTETLEHGGDVSSVRVTVGARRQF